MEKQVKMKMMNPILTLNLTQKQVAGAARLMWRCPRRYFINRESGEMLIYPRDETKDEEELIQGV